MHKNTKKAIAGIGAALVVVTTAGVAYAYYTTSVGGTTATGGASVSSTGASNLVTTFTNTGANQASNLVPGTSDSLVLNVHNPNNYNVKLDPAKSLHLDFDSMTSGDTACTPATAGDGNDVAVFSAPDVPVSTAVIAANGDVSVTFTVAMADSSTVDQTPCIGKTFNIPVTVV